MRAGISLGTKYNTEEHGTLHKYNY